MSPAWRRRLNLGLMALTAGLACTGLTLAWQWLAQASVSPEGRERTITGSRPAAALDRDPFSPPAGQGPQTAREETLEMLGVVIAPGETLALVRHGTTIRRLHIGESVGRFRLKEVRTDRLIFTGPDGERTREVLAKKGFAPPEPKNRR